MINVNGNIKNRLRYLTRLSIETAPLDPLNLVNRNDREDFETYKYEGIMRRRTHEQICTVSCYDLRGSITSTVTVPMKTYTELFSQKKQGRQVCG
jgi:hypothetical protein